MYYVRTTGGSMMAITHRSTAVISVKKDVGTVKKAITKIKNKRKKI